MNALNTYFKDVSKYGVLDADKQTEMVLSAQQGDKKAQHHLVASNLKFVISVARQYVGQGIPLEDLIAEGNLGILKAIDRFDPDQGTKFLTYAAWWIRQSILFALAEHNRQIRLPANRIGILQQYNKAIMQMEQELNREVSSGEVLAELGLEAEDLVRQSSVSYHTIIDEGTMLIDLLPNPDGESPDAALLKDALKQEIRHVLALIPTRERTILKMYYGFDAQRTYTLEEIGEKLGLTRERIRQLRNKAIKDLRRLNRRRKLENLKD
jgi:RNA polymerase primary sigma factor